MIYDTHVHTRFSVDSLMNPEEALAAASGLGIGICVTEHVDYETDSDEPSTVDADRYFGEYAPYKPFGLLLGLEIGLTVNTRAVGRQAASDPRMDFCIGSVHVSYGYDFFTPSVWRQGIPLNDIFVNYLKYTILTIEKCDFFDSLGHIDYPSRYSPEPEPKLEYKAYKKLFDDIFAALLDRRKVIELNTKRLGSPDGARNLYDIYMGYFSRGGRYVTLGSDAHRPVLVGRYINEAYRMIQEIGLTPIHYVNREMIIDA